MDWKFPGEVDGGFSLRAVDICFGLMRGMSNLPLLVYYPASCLWSLHMLCFQSAGRMS